MNSRIENIVRKFFRWKRNFFPDVSVYRYYTGTTILLLRYYNVQVLIQNIFRALKVLRFDFLFSNNRNKSPPLLSINRLSILKTIFKLDYKELLKWVL